MLDHFFPLLFPKDSESLKIFDIRLWAVGAKRLLNGTLKVNRQTDGRTNTQTDGHFDLQKASAQRALKIPYTGDKASLNRCGQQHRCHRRVDQEYPKNRFFFKTEKIIQNSKTQKRLEICRNQRYALRPEVSYPSGSMVSGWTKNT